MKSPSSFRFFFLVVAIVIGICLPLYSQAEEKPDRGKAKAVPIQEQKATLIQIYSWATILPKELIDLHSSLAKNHNIKGVEEELTVLAKEAEQLRGEVSKASGGSDLQLVQVAYYQGEVYKLGNRLKKLSEPTTATIADLSARRKEWQIKKDQISGYDKKELLALALAEEQQKILVETVDQALQLIETQLKKVLAVGTKIGDLQVLLYSADADLKAMDAKLRVLSIQQTSPSMLSSQFYTRINAGLFWQSYSNTRLFVASQLESLQKNRNIILLSLFAFLLVWFGIYRTKDLISSASRWYPFAVNPLSTTVFVATSLNALIDILPLGINLPQQWGAILHIFTVLAAIRLTNLLIEDDLRRRVLVRLIIFMAIAMLLVVLNLPQVLMLLYVFYVSLVALFYYFYQLPGTKGKNGAQIFFRRTVGILPAAVLILGISGYDQFAVILFSTLLSTVVACLVVWMLYRLHFGLLDLILSMLPFNLLRESREIILKSLQPILIWLHILLLAGVQGVVWGLYITLNEAFSGILHFGFMVLSLRISPGFFLTVILVIYGAFLASKGIQTLLLNKVLPRYGAAKGVQLSITRLAHYAILTIGFLIMLRVLGFELNQLALIGGALGVGIGFGLQAIVNNFASGLILLFERPIKVGDTIQIGSEIGEVKNLGLRATIIQTFDNAEIVVPNSDLCTGQVTNWTLGERRVRIRVPVGVAYGTDVTKVLKILLDCATANPMVLSTPKPTAFFLAFGSSSLDFEVRVWISEFLDKIQVLSDLNQAIESEFAINSIEIPFPQTDLHLRSVDESAAARMWGSSASLQPGEKNSEIG